MSPNSLLLILKDVNTDLQISVSEACLRDEESGYMNPRHEKGDPSMLASGHQQAVTF